LGNFLKRLEIYTTIPPTPILMEVIVKIMVELLSVLALASKQIKQGRFSKCLVAYTYNLSLTQYTSEKFTKKLLGESEIEAVLRRLDRLTEAEARVTVAQTLGVVHSLVGNVKTVLEGARSCMICSQISSEHFLLDGKVSSDNIRQDLGAFHA
jgi:hypothetical protein